MTTEAPKTTAACAGVSEAEEMAQYGITRVPVDFFHYGEFRYSRLEDALAQARRTAPEAPPEKRIWAHFASETKAMGGSAATSAMVGGSMKAPPKLGTSRKPDDPWCDSKGRNIVEGGYTP